MTTTHLVATAPTLPGLSTEELAAQLTLRPQSIRKRYCKTGAYYCLRPVKLPNRRLMWPADAIEQLAGAQ
ncbi:DNA-binding protein [Paraburkholderia sediminicola]|uniref:DNA-binding protein n=1 Tax=Paraburkholderia sediminicola TaxID=458836 RepID=UPI0038B80185